MMLPMMIISDRLKTEEFILLEICGTADNKKSVINSGNIVIAHI